MDSEFILLSDSDKWLIKGLLLDIFSLFDPT